jgi:hypothetical protein
MGLAYRLVRPQLTVEDIIRIRSSDGMRLTTSPFGISPEQYATNPPIYVGAAVAWKHHPERMPPAVRSGLTAAIAISKACAGVKGTIIYNGKLYPAKCIAQKKKAGKYSA